MNFEQIASDIAVRIFNIVDAERKCNPDGGIVSIAADTEIGKVQEAILQNLQRRVLLPERPACRFNRGHALRTQKGPA